MPLPILPSSFIDSLGQGKGLSRAHSSDNTKAKFLEVVQFDKDAVGKHDGRKYLHVNNDSTISVVDRNEKSSFADITNYVNKYLQKENVDPDDKKAVYGAFKEIVQHMREKNDKSHFFSGLVDFFFGKNSSLHERFHTKRWKLTEADSVIDLANTRQVQGEVAKLAQKNKQPKPKLAGLTYASELKDKLAGLANAKQANAKQANNAKLTELDKLGASNRKMSGECAMLARQLGEIEQQRFDIRGKNAQKRKDEFVALLKKPGNEPLLEIYESGLPLPEEQQKNPGNGNASLASVFKEANSAPLKPKRLKDGNIGEIIHHLRYTAPSLLSAEIKQKLLKIEEASQQGGRTFLPADYGHDRREQDRKLFKQYDELKEQYTSLVEDWQKGEAAYRAKHSEILPKS